MSDAFRLTLPSSAEHLATARSFAAAVARHYAIAGEAVEDLKIAISEACVDALVAGSPIEVAVDERDGEIAFTVEAPEVRDGDERAVPDELGAPARAELIRSLFDNASVETGDGRRRIRFSVSYR